MNEGFPDFLLPPLPQDPEMGAAVFSAASRLCCLFPQRAIFWAAGAPAPASGGLDQTTSTAEPSMALGVHKARDDIKAKGC